MKHANCEVKEVTPIKKFSALKTGNAVLVPNDTYMPNCHGLIKAGTYDVYKRSLYGATIVSLVTRDSVIDQDNTDWDKYAVAPMISTKQAKQELIDGNIILI